MTKRFAQCMCLGLTVCMLSTAMPFTGLAQEIPASSTTPTQTAEATGQNQELTFEVTEDLSIAPGEYIDTLTFTAEIE